MSKRGSYRTGHREKKEKKPFPWKKLGILLAVFVPVFCLYQYLLRFVRFGGVMPIYYALTAVLFLVFFFLNGGLTSKTPTEKQLPSTWSHTERTEYLAALSRRRRAARIVLYILVPLILTLFCDALMYVFWERDGAIFHPKAAFIGGAGWMLL